MSALWFRRLGMCAALIERKWRSAHSRRFAACLLDRTPPWWFMYETTDMLSVRINTCRSSSCGRKSLELRTLLPAPSGLCANGSEVLTTALKSACPRTLLTGLQSMRQSWPRHVTSPSPGEHPAEETLAALASELRCSRGGPRCANGPKSTPSKWLEISAKTAAGACVVNCPVWKGTGKTNWWPSAHLHCF